MMDDKPTVKQATAREYIEAYPQASVATLGRLAYAQHPDLWSSAESARSYFRYACRNPRVISGPILQAMPDNQDDSSLLLPIGKREIVDWQPYQVHGPCRALVLGDIHAPYHDEAALAVALLSGCDEGCDTIVLLGDFIDCYAVSRWEKDPRERNFQNELDIARKILGVIRSMFPKARIIFKFGNHDERLERYLTVKAPELLGVPALKLESLLGLAELKVEVVSDFKPIRLGSLNLLHGHEYGVALNNQVSPSRGLYVRAGKLAMCAHCHVPSQYSKSNLEGDVISCWSIGCLCDLHPRYMPINAWCHGFAVVNVTADNAFSVNNKRIINGKCYN